jgi:hypothetical protein
MHVQGVDRGQISSGRFVQRRNCCAGACAHHMQHLQAAGRQMTRAAVPFTSLGHVSSARQRQFGCGQLSAFRPSAVAAAMLFDAPARALH